MRLFLSIASIFISLTVSAQSYEVKSKTCNTSIALRLQNLETNSSNLISEWFVDATGDRPSGFGKSLEKTKYDSIRSILDKGYNLTPVLSSVGDTSTAKPGDLFLLVTAVCSFESASFAYPFCIPAVNLSKAVQNASGSLSFEHVTSNSLSNPIEGSSPIAALYRAIQASTILLPKCVIE